MSLQRWAGLEERNQRATLAVLFTDIIDSTAIARTLGDRVMSEILTRHFEIARLKLKLYDAYEIKTIGDAYMVAFRTADDALQFALNFRLTTGDSRIAIRVGIHVGPVRIKEDDIDGLVVNYASRLSHVHVRGEEGIFLSNPAKENIEAEYGSQQEEFRFRAISGANLKGFLSGESVWDVITPEIREARMKRMRAEAEKNRDATTIFKRTANASSISTPLPERPRLASIFFGPPANLDKE